MSHEERPGRYGKRLGFSVALLALLLALVILRGCEKGVVLIPDSEDLAPGNNFDVSDSDISAFTKRTAIEKDSIEAIIRWTEEDLQILKHLRNTPTLTIDLGKRKITAEQFQEPSQIQRTLVWKGESEEDGRLVSIAVVQNETNQDVLSVSIAISGGLYVQQLPGKAETYVVFHDVGMDSSALAPRPPIEPASSAGTNKLGPMASFPLSTCENLAGTPIQAKVSISVGILYSSNLTYDPSFEANLGSAIDYLREFASNLESRHGTKISWNTPKKLSLQSTLEKSEKKLWEKGELNNDKNEVLKAIREASKSYDLVLYITARPEPQTNGDRAGENTLNLFGLAQSVPATPDKFIAIVSENTLSARTILAHELSHLLGAEHELPLDLANEKNQSPEVRRSYAFDRSYTTKRKPEGIIDRFKSIFNRSSDTFGHGEPSKVFREGTVGADRVDSRHAYLSDHDLYCENITIGWSDRYANQAKILPTGFVTLASLAEMRGEPITGPPTQPTSEESPAPEKPSLIGAPETPGGTLDSFNSQSLYCEAVSFPQRNCTDDSKAVITLQFRRDVWGMTNSQKEDLKKVMAGIIHQNHTFLVTGHASSTGALANNLMLSRNRATSVSNYLNDLAKTNSAKINLRVCAAGPDLRHCSARSEREVVNQRVTIRLIEDK